MSSNAKQTPGALPTLDLSHLEHMAIEKALAATGSLGDAAKLVGLSRHTLKRRIIKYGIAWPPQRSGPIESLDSWMTAEPGTDPDEAERNMLREELSTVRGRVHELEAVNRALESRLRAAHRGRVRWLRDTTRRSPLDTAAQVGSTE